MSAPHCKDCAASEVSPLMNTVTCVSHEALLYGRRLGSVSVVNHMLRGEVLGWVNDCHVSGQYCGSAESSREKRKNNKCDGWSIAEPEVLKK